MKFYISQCKTGLLVEFDHNYYLKPDVQLKSKCNFVDQVINVVDKK